MAVVFDFVQPVIARRRFVNEARQLRLGRLWRPIGISHDGECSTFEPPGKWLWLSLLWLPLNPLLHLSLIGCIK